MKVFKNLYSLISRRWRVHSNRLDIAQRFGAAATLAILSGLFFSSSISAQSHREIAAWQEEMKKIPRPEKGCYTSSYPELEWQKVDCGTSSTLPMIPRLGASPPSPPLADGIIGNGNNISMVATGSNFTSVIGSFENVTVSSVESPTPYSATPIPDSYSLQINTNRFPLICPLSPSAASCTGWQQFIFNNIVPDASALYNPTMYIQYWLLDYTEGNCSDIGWIDFINGTTHHCYKSSPRLAIPYSASLNITNLQNIKLRATASASTDEVELIVGPDTYTTAGLNAFGADLSWTHAEFNLFGVPSEYSLSGNPVASNISQQAVFNSGATMDVKLERNDGIVTTPGCAIKGFTGETNNMRFSIAAPALPSSGAGRIFRQTQAAVNTVSAATCANATAFGDTHLRTFDGLFYDFQASGDFLLAETGKDFIVQTRQISGAPTWPNASVNSAVAAKVGKTNVAICTKPERIFINGKLSRLAENQPISFQSGGAVIRNGNVYLIRSADGDSVRVQLYNKYMNVSVGLGQWPSPVRGLLANVDGSVHKIATRDGKVLTTPFAHEDLYGDFTKSWRLLPEENMLPVCGNDNVETGIPGEPFFAENLDQETFTKARAVCENAGVKDPTLLNACTLDVAVIGEASAAQVFAGMTAPLANEKSKAPGAIAEIFKSLPWWAWILLLLIIFLIVYIKKKNSP